MKYALGILLLYSSQLWSLTCAVSIGYAPFQFTLNGKPAGIDVELVALYNETAKNKIHLKQMPWDKAVSELYYSKGLDCLWGMGVSPKRAERFLLSHPVYHRLSTIFVQENSHVQSIQDLKGKIIVGDKNSAMDEQLRASEAGKSMRIRYTQTKEESIKLLKMGKVEAVIMPNGVGNYFAQKQGLNIRALDSAKQTTPAVIAVKKSSPQLLREIQADLDKMDKSRIQAILKKWQAGTP